MMTFNVMMEEGREVAAAILGLGYICLSLVVVALLNPSSLLCLLLRCA
jgi:hypothetical protein